MTESYEPAAERQDPSVGVAFFLGIVLLGLMGVFAYRGLTERDLDQAAIRTARLVSAGPELTLAAAVAEDAAVELRHVVWSKGPARGPMRGVRAVARKGAKSYEYRFDVDLETERVLPTNPRAVRLYESRGMSILGAEE